MESVIAVKSKIFKFETDNERYLIKKSIAGDKKAFSELMKIYKIYLYKTAYSYVKNENDALEILQECTYRAMVNIGKLKKSIYFKTWITRIIINCSLDFINKNNCVYLLDDKMKITERDNGISIDEKLDLYNAIDLLRDNYKTVIILKYFNSMTIENIAEVMGIPENTVKTYLKRAKDRLSKILKEDYLNE
ncbi:sigma-70 family RNA polymerase sigma factor [Clostridium cellulovorans]|uniref:RNA polymerase, sigma-24 subunit, ECF subfamily n=1 Tax=Clostridium cellulovorans (strain ATCC 35296 / DSM 3052 / OCM 3 / 743B) TaxID=573061 RepID=D9SMK4_CLOC7|nr:sigma-70 family RNA polymerase sigma factor [Clostridium cellulovorans]ADL53860.1 RNA polymerase, sigma-24 subunit, ECF subfamily [Clostridium cellulovorans 743B]